MRAPARHSRGLTLLELMVSLAIIGILSYLGVGAVRWLRGANVTEASLELTAVMRRTQQLAAETGMLHRVVLDLGMAPGDPQTYRVEVCAGGPGAISRNPEAAGDANLDDDTRKAAVEAAKEKLRSLPSSSGMVGGAGGAGGAGGMAGGMGGDEQAEEMALALAGQLAARRTCVVAVGVVSGDADGRELVRMIDPNRSARVKQVWVQHLERPVSSGLVAIHFFPLGSAEKALVEIGDDKHVFTVRVHGLTGRVEVTDGAVRDADDFLMRDAVGDKEGAR
jgi:prepilin-type N-terminal cleavage/methylation domain-containing protein